MSKVVNFTAYSDVGSPIQSIGISGNIVYGTDFHSEQVNQIMIKTADNNTRVKGNNLLSKSGTLIMTGVARLEGEAFKEFVANILQHQAYYVGIEPVDCPLVNLGVGPGDPIVFVNKARYLHKSSETLARLKAPGLYDINFQYLFKVT